MKYCKCFTSFNANPIDMSVLYLENDDITSLLAECKKVGSGVHHLDWSTAFGIRNKLTYIWRITDLLEVKFTYDRHLALPGWVSQGCHPVFLQDQC